MQSLRIVFMGTPDFAVPSLEAVADGPDVVAAVLTQPDRAKGRGKQVQPPPVKVRAEALGIPVFQPERLRGPRGAEIREKLRELAPDLIVVAAYGQILPKEVLDLPPLGCVNVHASLLPRWRGASPIQWAVAAGDPETGISIMQLEEGLDTGPVLLTRSEPVRADDTGGSLHDRLAVLGADALRDALPLIRAGDARYAPQDEAQVTLAPRLTRDDGRLDFTLPAAELERRIRAFAPWPGAFTLLAGRLLKVHRAEVAATAAEPSPPATELVPPATEPASPPAERAAPGTVLAAGPEGLDVACAEGRLRLVEVQPEGRRRMHVRDLLAGHPVAPGTVLGR